MNNRQYHPTQQYPQGSLQELLACAMPIIVAMASFTLMQFTNRVFLSWYSTDSIAAIVPSGILAFNMICFFNGVTSFCNVLISQYFGNKQLINIPKSLWAGIYFSLFSAAIILLLVPVGIFIIKSSGHSLEVQELELQYFTITASFGGIAIINNTFSSFFIGIGRTRITMLINLIGNLANILFSYLLIFGHTSFLSLLLPVPLSSSFTGPMGIKGAAYSMVISSFIMFAFYIYFIFFDEHYKDVYKTRKYFHFNWSMEKMLLKYGIPSGVALFLEMVSFTTFVFLIGNVSKVALAANNITLSLELVSFLPILGLGIATSSLVGRYIGQGDIFLARKVCYNAVKSGVAYCSSLGFIFFFFPDFLINLFLGGVAGQDLQQLEAIRVEARILIKVLALFVICDAFNVTFGSAIKGGGDTRFYMTAFLLVAWIVFVPGVVLCLNVFKLPIVFAWGCSVLYLFLLAVIFFIRFKSGLWTKHEIIQQQIE